MNVGNLLQRRLAFALLITILCVPALTQPVRRLSTAPVNQSSTFSRVCDVQRVRPIVSNGAVAEIRELPELPETPMPRALPVVSTVLPHPQFAQPPSTLRAPPAFA
jgi:hypothetical protein